MLTIRLLWRHVSFFQEEKLQKEKSKQDLIDDLVRSFLKLFNI